MYNKHDWKHGHTAFNVKKYIMFVCITFTKAFKPSMDFNCKTDCNGSYLSVD